MLFNQLTEILTKFSKSHFNKEFNLLDKISYYNSELKYIKVINLK